MRQIGTLPKEFDPRPLTDHLTTLGLDTRTDNLPDGWLLWIYKEDHLAKAREELADYLKNPDDPRYTSAKESARAVAREKEAAEKRYRKNVRDLRGHWEQPNLRRRPLTTALIAVSFACFVFYLLGKNGQVTFDLYHWLYFSRFFTGEDGRWYSSGLHDILTGEVWRLVTPIFVHFSVVHIAFNMLMLRSLGSLIEIRRSTKVLALVVFLSAVASNVGQFASQVLGREQAIPFGGMSGVVYALLGYVWMKGRNEPEQGMVLNPSTVQFMLFWLVLCFSGALGPIANVAHLVGLLVGLLMGLGRI
ncbi:rhomboid family intramembrane serine protease [Singulisphaera rosea]